MSRRPWTYPPSPHEHSSTHDMQVQVFDPMKSSARPNPKYPTSVFRLEVMTSSAPYDVQRWNTGVRAPTLPIRRKSPVTIPLDILREQPSVHRQSCFHPTFPTQQYQANNLTTSQNQCLDHLHARIESRRRIQALYEPAKGHDEGYLWQSPPTSQAITFRPIFRGDMKSPHSKSNKQIGTGRDVK